MIKYNHGPVKVNPVASVPGREQIESMILESSQIYNCAGSRQSHRRKGSNKHNSESIKLYTPSNQTNKHGSSYLNSTIKALLNFSDVSDREISLIKSSYKESPTLNGSPKTLGFSSFVSDLNENKAHKRNNKIIAKVL